MLEVAKSFLWIHMQMRKTIYSTYETLYACLRPKQTEIASVWTGHRYLKAL